MVKELKNKGVNFDFNNHNNCELILLAEIIIVSPGVHLDLPILAKAREKGIPVISEVELAYQILNKPMVAVTGTNGKTTTTTLIAEMINQSDKKAIAAGNIGLALVSVDDEHLDYVIAEVSSYQLETIREFKPWISIILNIQPDHLERHGDMENYISQKSRIFINQTIEDFLVYNLDDEQVVKMASSAKCRKIGFTKKNTEILGLLPHEIRIPGEHNIENCLAAATAASLCGVKRETIAKVLKEFPGVEHRIELC